MAQVVSKNMNYFLAQDLLLETLPYLNWEDLDLFQKNNGSIVVLLSLAEF